MYPTSIRLLGLHLRRSSQGELPHHIVCSVARSSKRRTTVRPQFRHSKMSVMFTDKITRLDKENGHKTMLLQLLKNRSEELSAAFGNLSNEEKQELLTRHLDSKEERDDTPKRLSNVAVSRAVNMKLSIITNTVLHDLVHL
jgi:seryl-tRNA synthetase